MLRRVAATRSLHPLLSQTLITGVSSRRSLYQQMMTTLPKTMTRSTQTASLGIAATMWVLIIVSPSLILWSLLILRQRRQRKEPAPTKGRLRCFTALSTISLKTNLRSSRATSDRKASSATVAFGTGRTIKGTTIARRIAEPGEV